ncbi:MAG: cation-translocating P-type ATPase, partial [Rubrivivax sp.]
MSPVNAAAARSADTARLTPAQAGGVDDPAVLAQCRIGPVQADGSVMIGLGLSGLHCAACAIMIESALARVPGVSDVHVLGATQRARVGIDPSRVRLSALLDAVRAADYRAWPDAAVNALAGRRAEQRRLLWRLLVAWLCMMQVMMITTAQYVAGPDSIPPDLWRLMNWASWVLSLPVLLFSCGPFFGGAWQALKVGRVAMDTPVALGLLSMFLVSTGVTLGHTRSLGTDAYFDSLTMFVAFLLTGRWLEGRAREQVLQSLEALSGRLPEAVDRAVGEPAPSQSGQGSLADEHLAQAVVESVPLSALRPGDRVRVAVGQAFPADGVLVLGSTEADESLLTGESRAVPRQPGQPVIAGSLNLGAPVWCRVDRLGPDTRYQQIVSLVQQALTSKPGWTRAADRFAGPFLAAVLLLALVGGLAWWVIEPSRAVWVAVSVLVVTCPCALSLAAPTALLAAAGGLARHGVLVRRLEAIESLAGVRTLLFDKTGTLTDPTLKVAQLWHQGQVIAVDSSGPPKMRALLAKAAALAACSQHPLSQAVAMLEAPGATLPRQEWTSVREQAGHGLEATDDEGAIWRLGAPGWALGAWADQACASPWPEGRVWLLKQQPDIAAGEAITSAFSAVALGFSFDERLRPDARHTVTALRQLGVDLALLSGDQAERVHALSQQFTPALPVARAAATPEGKLAELQARQAGGHRVGVVGDGINDAPVLAQAQVSFALDEGAALARSQADFIVLGGRLSGVARAVALSRRAQVVVRQNLQWAAAYNFVCIPL